MKRVINLNGMLAAGVVAGMLLSFVSPLTAQAAFIATGGAMTNDVGAFRYHVFTNTVTTNFIVTEGGLIDVLIVGGGGGGGGSLGAGASGAGGGAGGLILSNLSVTADVYSVTVGSGGGSTGAASDVPGSDGADSAAFDLTAIGGGGGGTRAAGGDANGRDGGSGGGVGSQQVGVEGTGLQPGSASGGYGHDGGDSGYSGDGLDQNASGGGGGADGVGGSGLDDNYSGNGGVGLDLSDWLGASDLGDEGWFAGGGGGGKAGTVADSFGEGGKGGGADGGNDNAVNAMANTGGGGGGAGAAGTPSDGGSGIVVVRYVVADSPLSVMANAATGIGTTNATLNGRVGGTGGVADPEVYFCWGPVDGEITSTGNWYRVVSIGTREAGAFVSYETFELESGETYTYRIYATNSAGDTAWSEASSFKTLGAPDVNNSIGATDIVAFDATLNGALTNGISANVFIYWWVQGASVTNMIDFGAPRDEGLFSSPLSGLSAETTYHYYCVASNAYGTSTSVPTNFVTLSLAMGATWIRFVDGSKVGGANTGADWDNAWTNLQSAIEATGEGTNLWVATGTYLPTNGTPAAARFVLKAGVDLYGGFTNGMLSLAERDWTLYPTVLDGDIAGGTNATYVVIAADATVLDGFTVRNAASYGIYCSSGTAEIRNCRVENNQNGLCSTGSGTNPDVSNCVFHANSGYGIYLPVNAGGNVLVRDSRFTKNTSGVYRDQSTYGTFQNCVFVDNSQYGLNTHQHGALTVTDCVFVDNGTAGLRRWRGGATVSGCVFSGNGCGLMSSDANMQVYNSLFAGNAGIVYGAGAQVSYNDSPDFFQCTFAYNRTTQKGGGFSSENTVGTSLRCDPTLKNCILWGNSAAGGAGEIWDNSSYAGSVGITFSNIKGGVPGTNVVGDVGGSDTMDADPLFAPILSGSWSAAGEYDSYNAQTLLTDTNATWIPGTLVGRFVNPTTTQYKQFLVVSNSATNIVVWGDAAALAVWDSSYQIHDYHLQSTFGRWQVNDWVVDASNSPCINVGNPATSVGDEPIPHGNIINMGAYGGTEQASKLGDVIPPVDATAFYAVSGDTDVTLYWKSSISPDLSGVILLRGEGAAPSQIPVDGTTYTVGDLGGEVVYVGSSETSLVSRIWTNTATVNGTHYHYVLYSYDGGILYSAGETSDTTPSAAAGTAPLYVDPSASGDNNGVSWTNAYSSLQQGLRAAAHTGDVVWVATGVYIPGSSSVETFALSGNISLYGGFQSGMTNLSERDLTHDETTLSGDIGIIGDIADNSYHVVTASDSAVLDGFTISGGNANGTAPNNVGGGIYASSGSPEIRNCLILSNESTGAGGGLYSAQATPTVSNCTFRANSKYGASHARYGPDGLYVDCRFFGNTSGGYYGANASPRPSFVDCVFAANAGSGISAFDDGGVLFTALRCVFSGNSGTALGFNHASGTLEACLFGANGGVTSMGNHSFPTFRNCVMAGNVTTTDGAAVNVGGQCAPTLINCTLAGNHTSNRGGALASTGSTLGETGPMLRNCILWDNSATLGGNEIYAANTSGGLPVLSYSDITGGVPGTNVVGTVSAGGGILDVKPSFAPSITGSWSVAATFDATTGQTLLSDTNANWALGAFVDRFLNPNTTQYKQYIVVTNTANMITVWGNASSIAAEGDAYAINDYHLMSRRGRLTHNGWALDGHSSDCIDKGDPADNVSAEALPNGLIVNLGAYGGTVEASKTPPLSLLFLLR